MASNLHCLHLDVLRWLMELTAAATEIVHLDPSFELIFNERDSEMINAMKNEVHYSAS